MSAFRPLLRASSRPVQGGWIVGSLVVLGLLLGASSAPAQSASDRITDLREEIRERVDERKTHVGMVVGVVDAQGRRTFGYGQTREGGIPVDSSTVFEIGSLTKVFTGLLLADAVERDELSLEDPVEQVLPQSVTLPRRDDTEITVRHLVTHTSGLPRLPANLNPADRPDDPYADYTVRDLYRALNQVSLDGSPGTEYAYSNLGFGLLGHALAQVHDTTYASLVESRIAQPLGLTHTQSTPDSSLLARAATGHDATGRAVPNWSFTEAVAGAGALHGTVADLLTFLEAQLDLRALPEPLDDAIDRSHTVLYDGEGKRVAYGWHVRTTDDRRLFWHNGRTGGFASFMAFDPENEIGVVVLSNSSRSVDDVGVRLLEQKASLKSTHNPHRRPTIEEGSGWGVHPFGDRSIARPAGGLSAAFTVGCIF